MAENINVTPPSSGGSRSSTGIAVIVGGLVVAVLVGGFLLFGSPGTRQNVATGVDRNVNVTIQQPKAPAATPAATPAAPAAPAAPARQ